MSSMPSRRKTSPSASPSGAASRASTCAPPSISATPPPRRRTACPISTPTGPPPRINRRLGTAFHVQRQGLLAAEAYLHVTAETAELVDDFHHVHGDPDGAGLVGHRAG